MPFLEKEKAGCTADSSTTANSRKKNISFIKTLVKGANLCIDVSIH
jgi:hypothetical protein